ncbi:MAG TPA: ABC transporter ATP-binding protein [Anaerolineales bacterium]|nr:ABC transporter ATP-binding protein [Anaerolineales bacterium]
MREFQKLLRFYKPYHLMALLSMAILFLIIFFDLMIPRLIQRIVDLGIIARDLDAVIQTSLWMLGISVLNTIFVIINNYFSIAVAEGIGKDMRAALMSKIQDFSHSDLDHFSTGMLITRVTSDVSTLQRLIRVSLRIGTRAPLIVLGSIVMMFVTNTTLALWVMPLFLISLGLIVYFSNRMEPFFNKVKDQLDRLNTVLQENIAGALVVKSFARSDSENQRFAVTNDQYTRYSVDVSRYVAGMPSALTFLLNLGTVAVIWIGGIESFSDKITIGQIMAFTNYMFVVLHPLLLATELANVWANGAVSAKRVNEVLETIPSVLPSSQPLPLPRKPIEEIVFKNVSFGYTDEEESLVLEDVSLEARRGQTIAILGATGSGKTSLIHLVPRFYDISHGRIEIDGVDVRDLDQDELLSRIAIVPQESILFTGTIRENISFGAPGASMEQVIAAAKMAQAHDFIMENAEGYEGRVEERGRNFSGGQKQRLAIARALVTDPDILIFDDSTSAVDVETENHIQNALNMNLPNKINFIVAQRISTVLNADKILVLEYGKLAATGTHQELLKSCQIYREIYDSQLGGGLNGVRKDTNHGE